MNIRFQKTKPSHESTISAWFSKPHICGHLHCLILLSVFFIGSFARAQPVGTQEITFVIPNSDRPLTAEIYYPTEEGQDSKTTNQGIWERREFTRNAPLSPQKKSYPLVIVSHGWQGDRFGHAWLAEALVDEGYIVAAIDHTHNTSYENSAEFIYTSMWQRPLDMSALLDYLLQNPDWSASIDQHRIFAIGFSLGGLTTLWLTGIEGHSEAFEKVMQPYVSDTWPEAVKKRTSVVDWDKAALSYYDSRVLAIVSIAPDLGQGFKPEGLAKSKNPTLIIVGTEDPITPPSQNAKYYATHMKNTKLIQIEGAGHMDFLNTCSQKGRIITPHLCQDFSKYRSQVHKEAADKIIEFLDNTQKD